MKSTRLLSVLMLLQAHGRLSSREIAERLEVSERTAHRDMEALSEAGVPVFALRGSQGGWELTKGWRTKVPGLDEAELRGLLMAQPSALGDPKLAAAAERAFGKLMAALPGNLRDQAASIRARLHIDPTGWRSSAEDISMLPVVQDAIARDVKLTFEYRRADGDVAPRTVDPYGVVCKQTDVVSRGARAGGNAQLPGLAHVKGGGAGDAVQAAGKVQSSRVLEEFDHGTRPADGTLLRHAGAGSRGGRFDARLVPDLAR